MREVRRGSASQATQRRRGPLMIPSEIGEWARRRARRTETLPSPVVRGTVEIPARHGVVSWRCFMSLTCFLPRISDAFNNAWHREFRRLAVYIPDGPGSVSGGTTTDL